MNPDGKQIMKTEYLLKEMKRIAQELKKNSVDHKLYKIFSFYYRRLYLLGNFSLKGVYLNNPIQTTNRAKFLNETACKYEACVLECTNSFVLELFVVFRS